MGGHYTDLPKKRNFILQTITDEEERFHRTLSTGLALLDDLMARLKASGSTVIPGDEAFHLWDTYGFPIDLTNDVAMEAGFTVDESGFRVAMAEQKQKSRANALDKSVQDVSLYAELLRNLQSEGVVGSSGTVQRIYENLSELDTTVAAIIRSHASGNEIDQRGAGGRSSRDRLAGDPFLCGKWWSGQRHRRNLLLPRRCRSAGVDGRDHRYAPPRAWVDHPYRQSHQRHGARGRSGVGGDRHRPPLGYSAQPYRHPCAPCRACANGWVRMSTRPVRWSNPIACALTSPIRSRCSDEELAEIERRANAIILDNYPVNTRWTSYKRAVEEGAMALFGEKYGDEVRVVSFGEDEGISMELCGGTHVESTAEIGGFRITSEGSVAAGVRRIEVVTGRVAEALTESRWHLVDEMADLLHAKPDELDERRPNNCWPKISSCKRKLPSCARSWRSKIAHLCWKRRSRSMVSPS